MKSQRQTFFDTVTFTRRAAPTRLSPAPRKKRINLRFVDADHLGISLRPDHAARNVERLLDACSDRRAGVRDIDATLDECAAGRHPETLRRTSSYLTHPVFEMYHSETEMLRYLRHLQARTSRSTER